MIKLEVEDYCHSCDLFEADVDRATYYSDSNVIERSTLVTCKYRNRCANIYHWLLYKNKERRNNGGLDDE